MVIPAHGSGELRHARQSWNQRGFICGSIEPTNRLRSWLCSTLTSLVWGTAHSSRCCPASPLPLGEKSLGAQFHAHLMQLCVFRLGLLQDGDVGVGVFPEGEEILIGGLCLGGVALHGVGTAELEMGKCSDGLVNDHAWPIQYFLKLGCGPPSLMSHKKCRPSNVDGIHAGPEHATTPRNPQLIGRCGSQYLNRLFHTTHSVQRKLCTQCRQIIELHNRVFRKPPAQILCQRAWHIRIPVQCERKCRNVLRISSIR